MFIFYITNALGQNLANSESCLFLKKRPKSVICQKNDNVWATQQWPTSSELKYKFYPSLERPSDKLFMTIICHGQKNPPKGCSWGPPLTLIGMNESKKIAYF